MLFFGHLLIIDMKKILLALAIIGASQIANAQQLHFMSQYLQHNSMYNPAAAGMSERSFAGVTNRSMWSDFPGNPKTTMVYADFILDNFNSGISTYLYKDQTGPTSRTGAQVAYSYQIPTFQEGILSFGLELRGIQYSLDKSKITDALNGSGETDPVLGGSNNKFVFDAGAGVYWNVNNYTVGLAVSQLMSSKLSLADVPNSTLSGKLYRHYNLTGSYKIKTGEGIYVIPNVMYRLVENAPSDFDMGVKVDYLNKLWFVVNKRARQFVSLQTGVKIKQRYSVCYAYDYYKNPIGGNGAHEIGLQYDIN